MKILIILLGMVAVFIAVRILNKKTNIKEETSGGGSAPDGNHRSQEHDDKEEPGTANEAY